MNWWWFRALCSSTSQEDSGSQCVLSLENQPERLHGKHEHPSKSTQIDDNIVSEEIMTCSFVLWISYKRIHFVTSVSNDTRLWFWTSFVFRLATLILTTSGTMLAILITTTPMLWSQLKHTVAWRSTAISWMEIVVQFFVISISQKCTRRWETLILIASIQMLAFTAMRKNCNHFGRKRTQWVQHVLGFNLVKSQQLNCSSGTSEGVRVNCQYRNWTAEEWQL